MVIGATGRIGRIGLIPWAGGIGERSRRAFAGRERGGLMVELLVAMALLVGALLPLAYSIASEMRYARAAYQRAVAMEIVDGELEVVAAGGVGRERP